MLQSGGGRNRALGSRIVHAKGYASSSSSSITTKQADLDATAMRATCPEGPSATAQKGATAMHDVTATGMSLDFSSLKATLLGGLGEVQHF